MWGGGGGHSRVKGGCSEGGRQRQQHSWAVWRCGMDRSEAELTEYVVAVRGGKSGPWTCGLLIRSSREFCFPHASEPVQAGRNSKHVWCSGSLCLPTTLPSAPRNLSPALRREGEHLAVDVVKLHKSRPLERLGLKEGEARVRLATAHVPGGGRKGSGRKGRGGGGWRAAGGGGEGG